MVEMFWFQSKAPSNSIRHQIGLVKPPIYGSYIDQAFLHVVVCQP